MIISLTLVKGRVGVSAGVSAGVRVRVNAGVRVGVNAGARVGVNAGVRVSAGVSAGVLEQGHQQFTFSLFVDTTFTLVGGVAQWIVHLSYSWGGGGGRTVL